MIACGLRPEEVRRLTWFDVGLYLGKPTPPPKHVYHFEAVEAQERRRAGIFEAMAGELKVPPQSLSALSDTTLGSLFCRHAKVPGVDVKKLRNRLAEYLSGQES